MRWRRESIHHCSGLNEKFCAHETLEWLIEFHEWLHKKSFRIYSEKHSIVSPLCLPLLLLLPKCCEYGIIYLCSASFSTSLPAADLSYASSSSPSFLHIICDLIYSWQHFSCSRWLLNRWWWWWYRLWNWSISKWRRSMMRSERDEEKHFQILNSGFVFPLHFRHFSLFTIFLFSQ